MDESFHLIQRGFQEQKQNQVFVLFRWSRKLFLLRRINSNISKKKKRMFFKDKHFPKFLMTSPQSKWPPRPETETIIECGKGYLIILRMGKNDFSETENIYFYLWSSLMSQWYSKNERISPVSFEPEFKTSKRVKGHGCMAIGKFTHVLFSSTSTWLGKR